VLCGKECRDRKALIKHAWDHSREKCHSCSKCGKNFHNKARLKRHMASHRDKSVVCEVCQEYMEADASQPVVTTSQPIAVDPPPQPIFPVLDDSKPFVCQQCGLAFAREKALVSHTKVIEDSREYLKNKCDSFT